MPLTDTAVRNARPRERAYKLSDGRGLCLLIQPNGSKWWRFRYYWEGAEQMLSFGTYPDTPLFEARNRREAARQSIAGGIDPGAARRAKREAKDNTFESVADHYLAQLEKHVREKKRSDQTLRKARWALHTYIYPDLGRRPIGTITPQELLVTLKKIETKGLLETARRTKQRCGQIFRHAVGLGHASRDITVDLRGLLEAPTVEHHASVTDPAAVGALLRAIDGYTGRDATRFALKLAPLVFVRPGELRQAQWSDVDLANAQWRIAAQRMKRKIQHLVPLSRQALEILRELKALTGEETLLFPAQGHGSRPMSNNTINTALRSLGYSGADMTAHGFRSMASTLLNEQGWPADAIERQLSHCEDDEVRGAYNYAQHLPLRRRMMQVWADYLDELRSGRVRLPETVLGESRPAERSPLQRSDLFLVEA